MPIIEPAPWRHQYFSHIDCPDDVWIPADDPEAWVWNPRHRWVFDKLQVALSQGLAAGPHGVEPPGFPIFSKPIVNLRGMGAGSRVIADAKEYAHHHTAGHMWMPLLDGAHVSTDVAIVDGAPKWMRHATGKPSGEGAFDYWTVHAAGFPEIEAYVAAWIARHLDGYTGILNVETIGERIIEAHLRFTDQWPDLYGEGWVQALVGLYRDKAWSFADGGRREGFSVALFLPHGQRYRHPPRQVVDNVLAEPGISSVQITFHADRESAEHAMPPGGFRVALVNCWDLAAGMRARDRLSAWFVAQSSEKPKLRAVP